MAEVAERLRQMLGPLKVEYRTGCLNNAAIGGFDRHMQKLIADTLADTPPEHVAVPHLRRLADIFHEYERLDIAVRARRLREIKRRLDALLEPAPAPRAEADDDGPAPVRLEPVVVPGERTRTAPVEEAPAGDLDSAVQYLKGVGPQRAALLARLDIETIGDLIFHFPRRHEDRSLMRRIADAELDELATFQGRVREVTDFSPRPGLKLTKVYVQDGSGGLELVWFNQPWLKNQIGVGDAIIFSGKPSLDRRGKPQMTHPTWEPLEADGESIHTGRWVPIYPLTEGLAQNQVRTWAKQALDGYVQRVPEVLPLALRDRHGLLSRRDALAGYHFPADEREMRAARRRLVFEEFFGLQVALAQRRHDYEHRGPGIAFATQSPLAEKLHQLLPFELTGAQQRVLREIAVDLADARPMNRLVQGDVGSGKTLVALSAMLTVIDNGYQAALMAPTEVLAEQHHRVISRWCERLGVVVELFTGRAGAKQRREGRERLADGTIKIAVGTHALIQGDVEFQRLGLVVVDEQHRFGVTQRQGLSRKGETPDVLVMTATPIPRTLALTLYGDLDVSVIDELPAGRTPIATEWFPLGQRRQLYSRIKERLREGRQAYVVCPLIEESEALEEVEAVTDMAAHLQEHFKQFTVGMIHGRMKPAEKDEVMARFRDGAIDILAATTVIEVGIDVPNSTEMLIVNADRFGLAQLHQLRGRVGRGTHESHCYLLTDAKYNPTLAEDENDLQYQDARLRLKVMCDYTDGFLLAEADLANRGPGELGGTRQSGMMDLHLANLARDRELLELARDEARELIATDPYLREPEHRELGEYVRQRFRERGRLAEVG